MRNEILCLVAVLAGGCAKPRAAEPPVPSPSPVTPTPGNQAAEDPPPRAGATPHAIDVAAAGLRTCALLSDGAVRCWGSGVGGSLGDGTMHPPGVAASGLVAGLPDATRVEIARRSGCAVTSGGAVKCWGERIAFMHEGTPARGGRAEAVPFPHATNVVALDLGLDNHCLVQQNGETYCWGQRPKSVGPPPSAGPTFPLVRVANELDAVDVAVGSQHVCALARDRSLWCWGDNGAGQLGVGDTKTRTKPTRVSGRMGGSIVAVAAFDEATCALARSGELACWGGFICGPLSDCSRPDVIQKRPLAAAATATVSDFAMGGTLVVATTEGSVLEADLMDAIVGAGLKTVSGVPSATAVAAGAMHTCTLDEAHRVWCWGSNNNGQVKPGSTDEVVGAVVSLP
ncbi:MAG: hypothetical protein AAF721_03010 [Myxococcota bacterium]